MSFNGAAFLKDAGIYGVVNMAKWEIIKRTANPIKALWWKFMPGVKIIVKWPTGWTDPVDAAGGGHIQIQSADPNDHYRPYLEEHVGKQGRDWDWRIAPLNSMWIGNVPREVNDALEIKFRKGKDKYASYCSLKWN